MGTRQRRCGQTPLPDGTKFVMILRFPNEVRRVFRMARYTGPKARVNRRIGQLIYEGAGASRALERRDNPPGMHARGRRASNYGTALTEKQKIKHYYGMLERQLRRFFHRAQRMKGNTGEN